MQKTVIAAVLAAVLAGALGFFGGVTYQKTQSASSGAFAGRTGAGGFGRQGGANAAANVTTGTVIASDAQSITVKSADGSSKTVFVSAQTQIEKQQILKSTDLKVGDQIGAFGQATNGGIDARIVQVIPPGGSFRMGGIGGRGTGTGTTTGPGGSGQGAPGSTSGQ